MKTVPVQTKHISRRELRQNQTPAEEMLWVLLRDQRLDGTKFRRQHPLGRFIADFYCPDLRLAIELDGGVHKETIEQDRARDEAITGHNVRIVRLKNSEILNQPASVVSEKIRRLAQNRSREVAKEKKAKGLTTSPSPRDVEREGEARVRCELCDRPIRANQPALAIANGKLYKDKKALAVKNPQFICHSKCWEQIEDEDI